MYWAGFKFGVGAVFGVIAALVALAAIASLIAVAVKVPRATLGLLTGLGALLAFVVASPQQITAASNVLVTGVAVIMIVAVFWGLGAAILKRNLRPQNRPNDTQRD